VPWKTIGYIIAAVIAILFIAFNLQNTSDISFIFFTVRDVPVFFTVFLSIIIGCLIMLPVALHMGSSGKKKKSDEDEISLEKLLETDEGAQAGDTKKKKKKKRKKDDIFGEAEDISDLDIR
jgi:uncharacterized integral membrane protein